LTVIKLEVMDTYELKRGMAARNDFGSVECPDIHCLLVAQRGMLCIKRLFDTTVSAISLPVLSVFFLIIALIIKIDSKGPVFFRQTRVGKYGKVFRIFKFRTMTVDADKTGQLITVGADSRITRVGRVLRNTKIDELPQIINVVKGDMSFVGPRPEVPKYVELYSESQRQVLLVRPGITDIASIIFKKENDILALSDDPEKTYIEEVIPFKLNINLEYISNISIVNDLRIVFLTLFKILKK